MATILIGLLNGLILARHFEVSSGLLLTLALVSSLIALLLARKDALKPLWLFAFIASATLCFWAYGNIRLAPKPTAFDLEMPRREARLTLEVQTVMRSNKRYHITNVIARVLHSPRVGRLSKGDLIYARLKLPEQILLTEKSPIILQKGLLIDATGVLTPIQQTPKSAKQRDFEAYLKNIGVHYQFDRISELQVIKLPSAFARFCADMNNHFQEILRLGAPEDSELANIYVTMLLGKNSALSKEQSERYRITGTMHFFAISGLHIGVIAAVIAQFLLLIRVPRKWGPWIGLPLLYLYVEIIGASPSAMRAFLMAAFFWSSFAFYRQHSSFAALSNSAVVVLLFDPDQLWSLGFQLSYAVVASILLLGLPISLFLKQSFQIYQWLPEEEWTTYQRIVSWSLNKILPLFAISLSAWLASMPLCAAFFNFIAPGAILLNLLLVYLVAIVIINGVLSIGCATLLLFPVSEFINHAAWLVIFIMDGIVRLGTIVPSIAFPNGTFLPELSYAVLVAYFLSLFWLHRRPEKMKTRYICLPVIVLLGSMGLALSLPEL
jgi:competence protein ComEC